MLRWLRRRRQAERLAQADAEALPDGTTHAGRTPAHWWRVALIVAKRTGKKVGLDTATRMAADADLSPVKSQSTLRPRVHSLPLSPLDELKRILSRR